MTESSAEHRLYLPIEPIGEELVRLRTTIGDLEEEAIKKDQLLSQLMSRMREYEMGEYGLAEAVNEIKECKKLIRSRDREIEKLTDEINLLKLQISVGLDNNEAAKENGNACTLLYDTDRFEGTDDAYEEIKIQIKTDFKLSGKDKSCQCYIPIYPSKYNEDIYASKLQNEILRSELTNVCENAVESMVCLQKDNQQDQLKNESVIKKLKDHLLKLQTNTIIAKEMTNNGLYTPRTDKNRKSITKEENVSQLLNSTHSDLILQLAENWKLCSEPICNDKVVKLMELELKLLNEILLLKKLLEIAHHQTRELEDMYFSQELHVKALESHIALFQGKSDERMLLGKLAMKVLQLQFNQAAYLFELKKII